MHSPPNIRSLGFLFFLSVIISQVTCARLSETRLPRNTIIVQPGRGTLSAALTKLNGRKGKQFIFLKTGIYNDVATLNHYEDGVVIQGEGGTRTSYLDNKVTIISSAKGTGSSSALRINAPNVEVYSITFQNTHGPGTPAVALTANGYNHIYHRCAFLGFQDTLYDYRGTHHFSGCYIEGSIGEPVLIPIIVPQLVKRAEDRTLDFVFGGGRSFYENCVIGIMPNNGGVQEITANNSGEEGHEDSIFVFDSPRIFDHPGVRPGSTYYGRAWGPKPQVVFQNPTAFRSLNSNGWDLKGVGNRPFDGSGYRELPLKTERGRLLDKKMTKEEILGSNFNKDSE